MIINDLINTPTLPGALAGMPTPGQSPAGERQDFAALLSGSMATEPATATQIGEQASTVERKPPALLASNDTGLLAANEAAPAVDTDTLLARVESDIAAAPPAASETLASSGSPADIEGRSAPRPLSRSSEAGGTVRAAEGGALPAARTGKDAILAAVGVADGSVSVSASASASASASTASPALASPPPPALRGRRSNEAGSADVTPATAPVIREDLQPAAQSNDLLLQPSPDLTQLIAASTPVRDTAQGPKPVLSAAELDQRAPGSRAAAALELPELADPAPAPRGPEGSDQKPALAAAGRAAITGLRSQPGADRLAQQIGNGNSGDGTMSSSKATTELVSTPDRPGNATTVPLRSWRTPAPVLPDPAGSLELPHTVDGALDLETAGLNLAERLASETTLLSGKSAAEAWLKEIGLSLGGMVQGKLGRMSLQLDPAELGALEIEILTQDGVASVDFAAVQPATRDLLEASLPRLRELLQQQGLQLGDVVVRDQARQQQEQQRQRDEQFRQNVAADGDKPDAVTITMRSPRLNRSALLDAYV